MTTINASASSREQHPHTSSHPPAFSGEHNHPSGPNVHTPTSAVELVKQFVTTENKWQQRWFDSKAFEPFASADETVFPKGKFFFTIPYPYVTGSLHVGHGRTYTIGDVIARFRRMQGFNTLWPMAFHITGTPVLAIADKIKKREPDTLKLYRDYVSTYEPFKADGKGGVETGEQRTARIEHTVLGFEEPLRIVEYFSGKLIADFKSIGFSLDFSRQFTTGDLAYNKFVEWMFHEYQRKGYLVQAAYPLLYCVNDKNAVGEDDIKSGDEEKVEVQKFTAFKHKLLHHEGKTVHAQTETQDDVFLVTGTLRSDTAFGITNLFVNPAGEYVLAEVEVSKANEGKDVGKPQAKKVFEKWIVAPSAAQKLSLQNREVRVLKEKLLGKDFVGQKVETPTGAKVPVLPASFVSLDNATGIVHSVPAHAPFDYAAIEELKKDRKMLDAFANVQLEKLVSAIKPVGVLATEGFGEIPAKELVERLKVMNTREKGKLDKATKELYMADFYNATLNDKNPTPFAGMKAGDAKEKVAQWLVEQGKAAWFYETSRPAECRCGGKVVAAVMADQWFLDFNAKGWKDNAYKALAGMKITPESYRKQFEDTFAWLDKRPAARRRGLGTRLPFNKEWIIESLSDSTVYMSFYTVIKNIRTHAIKPDQLMPAFFSYVFNGEGNADLIATETKISKSALSNIRAEFEYWYPNDLRQTAVAHLSNHLSFYIFAHAALFRPQHWPKAIGLNELVISEGSKMSKSKGNVVSLLDLRKELPSDVYRLYVIASADPASTLDYRKRDAQNLLKSFAKWNSNMAALCARANATAPGRDGPAAKWFLSKFERAVRDSTKAIDEFRLRDYAQLAFYALNNSFAHFETRASEDEKQFVAKHAAARWLQLLAPLMPHASEEHWHQLNEHSPVHSATAVKFNATPAQAHFVSLSRWPNAHENLIDAQAEVHEDYIAGVLEDAKTVFELVARKGKRPTALTLIVASKAKTDELSVAVSKAKEPSDMATFLVKEVDSGLRQYAEKNFYAWKASPTGSFAKLDEKTVLESARAYLETQLNVPVSFEKEETSTLEKKARAMPLKPAVSAA